MAAPSISKHVKKVGKENAPPPRTKKISTGDDVDDLGGSSADEDIPRKSSKPLSKVSSSSKALQSLNGEEDDSRSLSDLRKKLAVVTSERDRYRTQRDTFSSQFEELTKTRSDSEGLFEKYKQKVDLQSKAQNDIIATQTALTEKLQTKVQSLEKALSSKDGIPSAGGPFDGKLDPKEVKALKEEMSKLKQENKSKDDKIAELQREHKAEVEHSRSLLQSQSSLKNSTSAPTQSSSIVSTTPEEAAKDAASLALYEDLTLLNIANVKIKPAKVGKDETFNCVMAVNGQSLNFKLRCYTEIDKSLPQPYVKTVHYTPELLQHESDSFVKKLDYFSSEFVVPREQLGGFLLELRAKIGGEDDE
ncbi:uncharacterized protein IL334_006232 [Kwoniella shivajii]|uniref:Monopolin complex subunit Csm1/Pcs1 C-terminal domain-containing protein n=1 Tax=Kwoniella shivajii TaxID=564305 RepID=A0ABZ1D5D0_9TREE|nr:hypothetical protein IL334_006232 [Kwoniella shivajii]